MVHYTTKSAGKQEKSALQAPQKQKEITLDLVCSSTFKVKGYFCSILVSNIIG